MPDHPPGDPLAGPTYKGFAATPLRKPTHERRRRLRPSRAVAGVALAGLALTVSLITLQTPAQRIGSAEKPPGAAPASPVPPISVSPATAAAHLAATPAAAQPPPELAAAPAPLAEVALTAPPAPPPPPEKQPRRRARAAPPPVAKTQTASAPTDRCSKSDEGIARIACRDPQIASLEREVNAAFAAAMRDSATPGDLARDQESWILRRNRTAREAPETVADLYRERIAMLQSHAGDQEDDTTAAAR